MSSKAACVARNDPPGWAARSLLLLIDVYRAGLAPLLGGHCRFWPSCSLYAQEAIRAHGPLRGSGLAVRRLLRCHPFHRGGYDPVPAPDRDRPSVDPWERTGPHGA